MEEGPAKRFCSELGIEGGKVVGLRGDRRDITKVVIPNGIDAISDYAFYVCTGLTSVTLPHALVHVGDKAFRACTALTSVVFRPPVSRGAFIAWSVGSSRHRANWQLTTLKQSRNVLRLITTLALWSRDVTSVDPDGSKEVFWWCSGLKK